MKKLFLCVALGLISQAYADDIQVQMTGNIYANTCIVDSASKNLTVDFGQAASSQFKDGGDTGEWKTCSLTVTHCPLMRRARIGAALSWRTYAVTVVGPSKV